MNRDAPELREMLWRDQQWYNRPDLIDRLFVDKQGEILKDIVQRQCLGPVKYWLYSVEYQDR